MRLIGRLTRVFEQGSYPYHHLSLLPSFALSASNSFLTSAKGIFIAVGGGSQFISLSIPLVKRLCPSVYLSLDSSPETVISPSSTILAYLSLDSSPETVLSLSVALLSSATSPTVALVGDLSVLDDLSLVFSLFRFVFVMGTEEKPLNPHDSSDDDFAPSYQSIYLESP
ncbi:hypothetical protein F2Q70_00023907 [Brassica cretica]|uniref:Uncharacterized protein n=1 Tax=Brassica cretica TaxID=69181 RepID=A0A8S9GSY5_BRACR|nr:hypothetical protein F2Q70_00023907 [Brassica cretica]